MSEQNKTVIRRFLEAWNNRQPEAFDELIAPDVVRHCQATPAVEIRSLGQLKEFLKQDTAIFPDSRQTIVHMVAEGDLIGVWATYEGHIGERADWAVNEECASHSCDRRPRHRSPRSTGRQGSGSSLSD
jgi:ketosteroid isomerase-like protein